VGSLVFLVVIGTSIWVFFDAPSRGLSRSWALGALLLWIVLFPWYLVERSKRASESASNQPPTSPPPGWYLDPGGSSRHRWWDGHQWTEHWH
jgi:hypothetical protein